MDIAGFLAAHPFWLWAGIAAALLAAEVATGSGWLLWPSAAAGVVGLLGLAVDLPVITELLIFAGLTIAATLLARRYMPRAAAPAGGVNDNVARLLGQKALAVQAFAHGQGRVSIDGKEWAAELEDGGSLPRGESVEVTGVSGGSRLRVRPAAR
jgi:hypothetical protein